MEFNREPPAVPPLAGLLSEWLVGTRRELVFVDYGPQQRSAVEALAPKSVATVEMNLEDAFIEYTRGPRRSLPLLPGGPADEGAGVQGAA